MNLSYPVPTKEKIYKIAKEMNISSEALVRVLHEMGHKVKSHMSSVDDDIRKDIEKKESRVKNPNFESVVSVSVTKHSEWVNPGDRPKVPEDQGKFDCH